ncbi:MAG: cytochrome b N-terminal domain-containing protein [Gemmatimonadaceae bacterium]|nr:cytochrome b N-terminal domain-containing protein [Gemmatimonadaceae bacterium]
MAPEATAQAARVPVEELHEAVEEGVTLRDGFGVVRILGETTVTGVEVAPVLSLFDADGRFNPTLDLAQPSTIEAAAVVLAIGQQSDTDFLADTPSITRTPWGGIAVDASLRSSDPRVWAAGDVATGPRDLIDAIAAGQKAAASIMRARADAARAVAGDYVAPPVSTAPPMQGATRFWSRYEQQARAPLPVIPPQARDATAEVEHSFTIPSARLEASRCLRCDEHMQFSATRCIGCALCVDVCPQSSLALLPANGGRLAMVFDDDTCIRCGLCVHRCPTDALHFTLAPVLSAPVLPALPHVTPSEISECADPVTPRPRSVVAALLQETTVYRSIVRTPSMDSPSGRALHAFGNVFLHMYPVRVPRALLRFRSTWRLGFISSVLFALLFITGLYLMFFYTPSVSIAYGDMQQLRAQVGFGQLIRNVHRWGAHLMVLAVILHLVRVFVDGGYKAPRQFNWVIGVGLLVITLAYSFTGYLLPWDQLAYWAVTVGSDLVKYAPGVGPAMRDFLLGGETIGQAALLRFYVIHVAILTLAFALLMAVHLWRVRKDGLVVGDPPHAHDVDRARASDRRSHRRSTVATEASGCAGWSCGVLGVVEHGRGAGSSARAGG